MEKHKIAVIGLGYVGLPLARLFSTKYETIGYDLNTERVVALMKGHDDTLEVNDELLQEAISRYGFRCTAELNEIKDCNIYIVAVPTPVDCNNRPDLRPLIGASKTVGKVISKGDIVIYESTVYPGVTEAVRRKPYSVVLFDEIEKAHPDFFNILLQVLDDGRITDSHGKTVDFKNTIIILTSNLGSDIILDGINDKGEIGEEARNAVSELLKRSFRPEFLNRLDEIIFYHPLTRENIRGIVDLKIREVADRLSEQRISIKVTEAAINQIIEQSFDPAYGARPIKRFIQSNVETLIARKMIGDNIAPESTVTVDYRDGRFTADVAEPN